MDMFIIDNQVWLRLACFCIMFILMALWEKGAPRRALRTTKGERWFTNISITILNAVIVRFLAPLSATGAAYLAVQGGWGLLNHLRLPPVLAAFISVVLLDLTIYLQHFLFHKVRLFWHIHAMHHTDLDIDVTTGARFHPFEIVLSLFIKMGVIILFGISTLSVVMFEILLNLTSMFNHSNVCMNQRIERVLRFFLVTPDMHRVHHSVIIREHNSNFGFNLSWWDRLFGTYKDRPDMGHEEMVIGLANFRDGNKLSLSRLLLFPFTSRSKI